MDTATTKDFGPIRDSYAFFEDHATEAAEDIRAYAPYVHALADEVEGPLRMLDFGCGSGKFSAQLHQAVRISPRRLCLSLVEPVEVYRRQAVERLQPFTDATVQAWPELPADANSCFELVLANHVLYYVPQLDDAVAAILRGLAAGGLFLTAMAGQRNTLIQFWIHCFALIGKPVPFYTAEDFQAALARRRIAFGREDVTYDLVFPDCEAHRLRILRFLLGEYFGDVPRPQMLDLFNPYARGDKIAMSITHEHYVVRRPENAGI